MNVEKIEQWETAVAVTRAGSLGWLFSKGLITLIGFIVGTSIVIPTYHDLVYLSTPVCTKHTSMAPEAFYYVNSRNQPQEKLITVTSTSTDCKSGVEQSDSFPLLVLAILGGILTIIAVAFVFDSLGTLFEPWLWIGAVKPELKVAKDIFDRVLDND